MAIYRILQNMAFEPELVDALAEAYEGTLRALRLRDRSDPVTKLIANRMIELAQAGERDPSRLRTRTLAGLGIQLSANATTEEPVDATVPAAAHRRILIVENDEAFAYAAARHFERLGYETIVASGSLAGLREIERQVVDIVIADVCLNPGEPHGVSFGRMIRNRDTELPIVLVTAYPELLEQERPLPGPAFTKPVDLGLLASAVKAALH